MFFFFFVMSSTWFSYICWNFATSVAFAAVLAAGVAGAASQAQALILSNGSFEDSSIDPGTFATLGVGNTSITDWIVSGGTVDYIGTYWDAADGHRSLDMNGLTNGSISQMMQGLTIGQQYRVDFDLAGNTDGSPTVKTLRRRGRRKSKLHV